MLTGIGKSPGVVGSQPKHLLTLARVDGQVFQAESMAEAKPWWQERTGRWDLQVQSLSLGGAQSVTLGRQQGPRGGDRKPLQIDRLEGGSPSIQITSQPCLDQLDPQPSLTVGNKGLWASHYPSPAHRHEEHYPGHPSIGQGGSPPSIQAIVRDLGPITTASSSKANQLEARDRAAWVSFSLKTVAWLWAVGKVTYVLQPRTCQGRGGGKHWLHPGQQFWHPTPALSSTPGPAGVVRWGKPFNLLPLSGPRQGLGSYTSSPRTTLTLITTSSSCPWTPPPSLDLLRASHLPNGTSLSQVLSLETGALSWPPRSRFPMPHGLSQLQPHCHLPPSHLCLQICH